MVSLLKTLILFSIIIFIFALVGVIFGLIAGELNWTLFFIMIGCIISGALYIFSERIILIMSGAKPLDLLVYKDFSDLVGELCAKYKLSVPKLFITQDLQVNIFSTGRSPGHASLIISQSMLNVLSKEEILAVVAHELAHIKKYHILICSISAVLASIVLYPAYIKLNQDTSEENEKLPVFIEFFMDIFIYFGVFVARFGMSRGNEFSADKAASRVMGSGIILSNALQKIAESAANSPMHINPVLYSLYIYDPLGGLGGKMSNLFLTHPQLEERMERLSKY